MQKNIKKNTYYNQASVADLFVDQLVKNNVEAIYINSGTDTVPIQEAFVKRKSFDLKNPKLVLCLDELVAGSAAHGHYLTSNTPQAVIVHVDVGTLQLGGSLHNAQRGRAGILFFAGRAPYTIDQNMAGERSAPIHWIQEQLDQHGIVRNYTKWDYELTQAANINIAIQRAVQIASSFPQGPVYMSLPRETLMQQFAQLPKLSKKYPAIIPPPPLTEEIELVARKITKAKKPIIITSFFGQDQNGIIGLKKLSEYLNIPVFSTGERMNFPTNHNLFMGTNTTDIIDQADFILILDSTVPYIPSIKQPAKDAYIIQVDQDVVKKDIPIYGFTPDLAIQASSALFIDLLVKEALKITKRRIRQRPITKKLLAQKEKRFASVTKKIDNEILDAETFLFELGKVIDKSWVILDESVTNSQAVSNYMNLSNPGQLFKSGGSSLGWALGASLGMKIANPNKNYLAIVGDGTFIYGCPTASLSAAKMHNAPFITIILNNGQHYASKRAMQTLFPNGLANQHQEWPATDIDPSLDYIELAKALGCHGIKITNLKKIYAVFNEAKDYLKKNIPVVIDVQIPKK